MNWKQFLNAAHPEKMAVEESQKNFLFRSHRWVGLRLGYVLYKLGMSANFISIGRMLISITSFYFISLAKTGNIWMPFIGAFLLYGQNILDHLLVSRPVVFAVNSAYNPVSEAGAGISVPGENPEALAGTIIQLSKMPARDRQEMGKRAQAFTIKNLDYSVIAQRIEEHF